VEENLRKALERFAHLPNEAIVPTKVSSAVTGLSERSIRYHDELPRVYLSAKRYGQRVSDLRRLLAGKA
jgi:hypothetical protein